MNLTTITKKNEEENYPAHYPSQTVSSNKSICTRNNHLQKAAVGGGMYSISRRKQQPIPVFLPEEFHGQRSLKGYSPWGHKELDTTE